MLPSAGLWLNASKSESMLESDETSSPQTREMRTHSRPLKRAGDDRVTDPPAAPIIRVAGSANHNNSLFEGVNPLHTT